jgi:hypothetical protein
MGKLSKVNFMEIRWEKSSAGYCALENGYLGKWKIFTTEYDGTNGSKNPDGTIILRCKLPGIKNDLGNHIGDILAKAKAQKTLDYWLKNAGIKEF